jgi:hypothetical protein
MLEDPDLVPPEMHVGMLSEDKVATKPGTIPGDLDRYEED